MATSNAAIFMLSVAAVLCLVIVSSDCKPNVQGLHLESYSEQQVKGCYNYNQTLGICFGVRKGFMKLLKTTGEAIVFFQELGSNMFYYNVLDQGFIGHGPSMIYVPDNIPRVPHELREFLSLTMNQTTEETPTELETLKSHYQQATRELHNVQEIQLLELVSVALNDNSTQLDILKPFHALCFNLLKTSDFQIPAELRQEAVHDLDDESADKHGERQKRCSLTSDPQNNYCTGMCGPSCRCWSWVCGDCCWHRGCYKHDMCCQKDPWSAYCLVPFFYGFSCTSYVTC
ncbi:hypothetical protein ACROYT_G042595 [Oculina patagonica]